MKERMLYKTLVVGVIALFVGIGIQPAFAEVQLEDNDEKYINITSEFTGLRKKHSIKMTQQEIVELDTSLDSIYMKLNNSQSEEEASQIFNEAIMLLDKYDLLCGLSIEQVKRRFSFYNRFIKNTDSNILSENENTNCLILGRVTNTYFYNYLYGIIETWIDSIYLSELIILYALFKSVVMGFGFPFFPLQIGSYITIGWLHDGLEWYYYPAVGWITTIGSNGTKSWNGELAGTLGSFYGWMSRFFIGVEGFFGFKILNPQNDKTTLLGFAKNVGINYH